MIPFCPSCKTQIPAEDINVAKDVAFCRPCNEVYALSDLSERVSLSQGVDVGKPVDGAWFRKSPTGIVIGATHRSLGGALGALGISLFWNGIVSIFVCLALSSTLRLLHVPTPEWFPAPKMNDETMGVGMTLFIWLFLTPFIAIGSVMVAMCLSCIWGRTELTITNSQGVIFTGIGPLGYRRRFQRPEVESVRLHESTQSENVKQYILIKTQAGKPIKFGTLLTPERRRFVAAATAQILKV